MLRIGPAGGERPADTTSHLSPDERADVFGGAAARAHRLGQART